MKLMIILSILFSSHVFSQSIETYVKSISLARVEVESNIDQKPYQKNQQDVFKKYFNELEVLIEDIKDSSKLSKRYQGYFSTTGVSESCKVLFLDKTRWNELIKNCTKNRFFLCAEEVKAFGLYKNALKELLPSNIQQEFSKEPNCEI